MSRRITLVALALGLAALAALYFSSQAGRGDRSEPAMARQEVPKPPAEPAVPPPLHQHQRTATPAGPEEPKVSSATGAPSPRPPSEGELMEKLRASRKARDARAMLEVISQLEFLYPDSALGPERSNYAIDAFIALNRIHDAREEAYKHFGRYPNSPFASRVHAQTGVRPPVRPPPGSGY